MQRLFHGLSVTSASACREAESHAVVTYHSTYSVFVENDGLPLSRHPYSGWTERKQ
jgi:hypothetical protein